MIESIEYFNKKRIAEIEYCERNDLQVFVEIIGDSRMISAWWWDHIGKFYPLKKLVAVNTKLPRAHFLVDSKEDGTKTGYRGSGKGNDIVQPYAGRLIGINPTTGEMGHLNGAHFI